MNETLKQIRINALQYSEKDMAAKLGMPLSEYQNIENRKPLDIILLSKLAQAVNKSIEDLINAQKQEIKFDIDNAFQTIDELKDKLKDFECQINKGYESKDWGIRELLYSVNKMVRKPRVAFVGRSDVGKSTLINTLIGSKTVPEAWTPTTSIIVYVKHVSNRPSYCTNDVMVFKSDENANIWDDTRLSDEKYTKSFCIAEGDYTILNDYGARQGGKYEKTDASSAVVFVDSEILNNCDLLDLPGYGTKDREEDDSLLKKVNNVDVLIYMSIANGFMRGDDINWLQGELPNLAPISLNNAKLKPLSNLYIVASQAHTVSNGSIDALKTILNKGAERFEQTLSPNYWNNLGQAATFDDFRSRFFTYSIDQESLRDDFENDIKYLLVKLPGIIKDSAVDYIKNYAKNMINDIEKNLRSLNEIKQKREEKKKEIEKIEAGKLQRIKENEDKKEVIINRINSLSLDAANNITISYNTILTVDNIVKIIEENNWDRKEEDMKQLSAKLSNLLNDSYTSVINKYSQCLSDDIDVFLHHFENTTNIFSSKEERDSGSNFNVRASFARGLIGLNTYGAFSTWTVNLGNLGAYIFGANGASLLAAMGISVGGAAAAYAALAIIGYPIVLITILTSLASAMFSGGWKKAISKKIVSEYEKKNFLTNYLRQNDKYWHDTQMAFKQASEKLEKDYENYIENLKKEVCESDDEINAKIEFCKNKISVYQSLINKL